MRALLDTQTFVLLSRDGISDLGRKARAFVTNEENDLLLSSISITELAIKTAIGKFETTREIVAQAADSLRVTILPYEARHANLLFDLPLHHREPFDRMLIATAVSEGVPLIGGDREFKRYKGLSVIW